MASNTKAAKAVVRSVPAAHVKQFLVGLEVHSVVLFVLEDAVGQIGDLHLRCTCVYTTEYICKSKHSSKQLCIPPHNSQKENTWGDYWVGRGGGGRDLKLQLSYTLYSAHNHTPFQEGSAQRNTPDPGYMPGQIDLFMTLHAPPSSLSWL